jgi:hypothetical protein
MTQQDAPAIPDTLVHYYTNEDHIFKTITSYQEHELDTDSEFDPKEICEELPLNGQVFPISTKILNEN